MKKENFVCTSDEATANKLKECGFTLVEESSNHWKFLNDANHNFESMPEVTFTNMLHI
jgi:hypothetical protein